MRSWFRDTIIYQIFIDRFAGFPEITGWEKPKFLGGNLRGIIEKLDYLYDLGVTALWLSPFCQTSAYHGYHITDFFKVDPDFGTEEELKELISRAHAKNLRIITDFVPNHCSAYHPIFQKAQNDRDSLFYNWFYFKKWPDDYLCFLDFKILPKFNLDNKQVGRHLIDAAKHWLYMGIDGFRIDHAIGIPHTFLKMLNKEVKAVNPEAVLIGEAWIAGMSFKYLKTIRIKNKYLRWLTGIGQESVEKEYYGELDGVLDFYFRDRIIEYIAWKEKPEDYTTVLHEKLQHHYRNFPDDYLLPSFIDNHDMSRFLFECGQNREKMKKALELQFSLPHPPVIYYGTETGLSHHKPVLVNEGFSDIQARRPMPWQRLDKEMLDFTRALIQKRKSGNGNR